MEAATCVPANALAEDRIPNPYCLLRPTDDRALPCVARAEARDPARCSITFVGGGPLGCDQAGAVRERPGPAGGVVIPNLWPMAG